MHNEKNREEARLFSAVMKRQDEDTLGELALYVFRVMSYYEFGVDDPEDIAEASNDLLSALDKILSTRTALEYEAEESYYQTATHQTLDKLRRNADKTIARLNAADSRARDILTNIGKDKPG